MTRMAVHFPDGALHAVQARLRLNMFASPQGDAVLALEPAYDPDWEFSWEGGQWEAHQRSVDQLDFPVSVQHPLR